MKQSTVVWSLGLTILLVSTAWSAPKRARRKVAKPLPITAITLSWEQAPSGGMHDGAGWSYTLRSDGKVLKTETGTGMEEMDAGDTLTPHTAGTFDKQYFERLVEYLTFSRVLDLKIPARASNEPTGESIISVVRGGKAKSIHIPDDTSSTEADSSLWVMQTLITAITGKIDWKDSNGHSINTGVDGYFQYKTAGLSDEEAYAIMPPGFSALDAAGKKVGMLAQSSASGYFRVLLPPGTYRLVRPEPGAMGDAEKPGAKAYAWRAPATIEVKAGSFTRVTIVLQKMPTAP